MNNSTRPEVERLITYIEDEFCRRMDIDDFDRFFTDLATELMRKYGPSVPGDFGGNCLTCGLYIESCKERPASTRPEAVQEAMDWAYAKSSDPVPWCEPSRVETKKYSAILAAYVRELEAERDRLKERNAELERIFDLQHKRSVEAVALWHKAHPGKDDTLPDLGDLLAWLMAELAEARKERG